MNKQASTYNASTIVCYTSKTHIVLEKKNISYKKKSKPHLVFERELGTMVGVMVIVGRKARV